MPHFLVYSSAEGHLGCFQILAFVNNTAMNIYLLETLFSTLLGIYPEVELLDCMLILFLNFFKDFIYLTEITSRQRGRKWGQGSRLPAEQRARCGTRSQDPEIMT